MPVPPLALPRARAELQPAVVAVAGVDAPVAAALALRDGVPVAAGGIGGGNDAGRGAMISAPAMAVRAASLVMFMVYFSSSCPK